MLRWNPVALQLVVDLDGFSQVKYDLGTVFVTNAHRPDGAPKPVVRRIRAAEVDGTDAGGNHLVEFVLDLPGLASFHEGLVEPGHDDESLSLGHDVVVSGDPSQVHGYFGLYRVVSCRMLFVWLV